MLLVTFCRWIYKLLYLYFSPGWLLETFLLFSRRWSCSSSFSLSLAHQLWSVFLGLSLFSWAHKHALEANKRVGIGKYGFSTQCIGEFHGPEGRSLVVLPPEEHRWTFCWAQPSNTIWNSHLPLFQYLPPSSCRAPTLVFWVLLGKIGIISFCDAILHWVFILLTVTYFCLYISPQTGFLLSNWGIWVVTHYFLFPPVEEVA